MTIPATIPGSTAVQAAAGRLVAAAQAVLDDWVQDADGYDEILGHGGACQDVAAAMAETLGALGVSDIATLYTGFDGGHVFLVANLADGVFEIDIPPSVYETGAGYVWKKRAGVRLAATDVVVARLAPPMPPDAFEAAYCDA